MSGRNGFFAGGARNLYREKRASAERQVQQAYAERLEQASYFERRRLRREMKREVVRLLKEKMPSSYTLW